MQAQDTLLEPDSVSGANITYMVTGASEYASLFYRGFSKAIGIMPVSVPDSVLTNDQCIMLIGAYFYDLSLFAEQGKGEEIIARMPMMRKLAHRTKAMISANLETRLKKNKRNKDSLVNMINEEYFYCEEFWEDNGEPVKRRLFESGMTIECVYIAVRSIPNVDSRRWEFLYFEKLGFDNLRMELTHYETTAGVIAKVDLIRKLLPDKEEDLKGMNTLPDLLTATEEGRSLFLH